jgi:hypothetical protein
MFRLFVPLVLLCGDLRSGWLLAFVERFRVVVCVRGEGSVWVLMMMSCLRWIGMGMGIESGIRIGVGIGIGGLVGWLRLRSWLWWWWSLEVLMPGTMVMIFEMDEYVPTYKAPLDLGRNLPRGW